MPLLDFNNLIICNNDSKPEALKESLDYFSELGIRRFVVTYGIDPATTTFAEAKAAIKDFRSTVMSVRPRGTELCVYPSVHISKGVMKNPVLKKLSFDGTRVFINIPFFIDDTWFLADINYLLYKQKLKPVFLSFERNLLTSDYEFGNKLYKTQSTQFALDLNFITGASGRKRVLQAIYRNVPVIPCVSGAFCNYEYQLRRFEILKERLGAQDYYRLCRILAQNGRSLFI